MWANAKLEREGKVVYGGSHFISGDPPKIRTWVCEELKGKEPYRALLIAIEPIGQCKHPSEKVKANYATKSMPNGWEKYVCNYECQCGKLVKPSAFEVCDE